MAWQNLLPFFRGFVSSAFSMRFRVELVSTVSVPFGAPCRLESPGLAGKPSVFRKANLDSQGLEKTVNHPPDH